MLAAAQVRAAVQALLVGATDAGARVMVGRSWPIGDDQLPAIKLAITSEEVTADGVHFPAVREHDLTLEARAFVRDVDNLDTAMDHLAEQVLQALFADADAASLEPLPSCVMELAGIDRVVRDPEGEASTGAVAVRLRITFQTLSDNPSQLV